MKVFVLSQEGKPLMPTTPRRARVWLKAKRARVVRQDPFTIRLRFATRQHVQPGKVGVDTGSKEVGIAATSSGEVVFQAEMHLRDDITGKMTQRRHYRRNRRRPDGWLPPSLHSKSEATVKAVRFLASFLSVGRITVEAGSFDTQKMQHPDIAHLDYQHGELRGYFLREYVLEKWQRKCAYCGGREIPLEIEHIVPKSRGGSNRTSNLTLACHACNQRKGQQTAAEFGFPQIRCLARGHYQRFNGLHSEHKCWAPRKVRGFKLYELVKVKGEVGYITGRREKGAFVIKDVASGKKRWEVTPRKLARVARPTHGWMMTRQPVLASIRKEEGGASSPS